MGVLVNKKTDQSPWTNAAAVTPHDTNELSNYARSLWIGGAGSGGLKITTLDGVDVTFAGVPVGIFPVSCKRVFSTGTNVTNVVALW